MSGWDFLDKNVHLFYLLIGSLWIMAVSNGVAAIIDAVKKK